MPVLRNITIPLNADEAAADVMKGYPRAELMSEMKAAVELGRALWQPKAIYEWLDSRGVRDQQLVLVPPSGLVEVGLKLGPKVELLRPAKVILGAVCTIGSALEKEVSRLAEVEQSLRSYFLDCVGVLALGAVQKVIRAMAEEEACSRGWGVSAALHPGSLVGWSVKGQSELCALLSLERIGVRLNENCQLLPLKSISMIIGLGPEYETRKVGSICRYCKRVVNCWRRRDFDK